MGFNVSSWAIRNPTATILLFILLTFVGLLGFRAMKVQNFPDIELPSVTVTAVLPGAAPSQIENDVARKIENALATIQGVKHIESTLTDGAAEITIEFRIEKRVQEAVDDVRDAVSRIRADLPAELRDPIIKRIDVTGAPILTYTVASSRMDDEALSWFVDNQINKRLLAVPGVGAVARVGGVTREVRVGLDPVRLLAFNATAADISRQLRESQQEASGGRVDLGGMEQSVRTIATVGTAQEIAQLELTLGDGRRLRLDQVATISDTIAEPRSRALLNGEPVVAFEITRARGAGEIEVAEGVRAALESARQSNPGITITEAFNFVDPVVENYQGSMMLLYEGAALAVLVVFLFLRDWRATMIAAVALPLSAIPTFAVLHLLGFTANTVSLLALSLVIGVLVDDAIVEIENIERHVLMGKPPYQAAMQAADEIGLAVIATTFTLIAVFLPTSLMSGIVGKYFLQFGWTAAIAVFFSLVVARMLTPTMAAYLLKSPTSSRVHAEPRWVTKYLSWARLCLSHRLVTMVIVCIFLVGGLLLAAMLPGEFIPQDDTSQTQVTLSLPPGSKLQDTAAMAERARAILQRNEHAKMVYTAIGGGSAGSDPTDSGGAPSASVTTAILTVNLTHRSERRGLKRQAIESEFRQMLAALPGVRIKVGMDGSGENLILVMAAEDSQRLAQHVVQVERELRTLPGIGAVTSSASLVRRELVIRPDFARAADLGVTSASIADTLRVATLGDYDQDLAKLNLSERQVPVVVRLTDAAREDLETLRRLPVPGARGPVPLESVASLQMESGPSQVTRYDRMRNVNFEVELNGRALGDIEEAAMALPSLRDLPRGVVLTSAGDAEAMGELVGHADRRPVHLHGFGAAAEGLRATDHGAGRAGAVDSGGFPGAVPDSLGTVDAGDDRVDHADGHRDQERDPADRLHHHCTARSPAGSLGGDHGRLPQACSPDRHDDDRDGRGHAAHRTGYRGRSELPLAHGDRRDRRADHIDVPEPAGDSSAVQLCRRPGALAATVASRAGLRISERKWG